MHTNWSIIIIAAGKGTRMGGDVPKPLVLLAGKPLIEPIIETSLSLRFREVVVVVSEYTRQIKERFTHEGITYVETEPRGTGYSVSAGLKAVSTPNVIIAQADDSYFYTEAMLQQLMAEHESHQADFTMGITRVTQNMPYASVEYDSNGELTAVKKSPEDLCLPAPKDVAAGLYAANVGWLTEALDRVPFNSKGEQSLPRVVDFGLEEKARLFVFHIPEGQWQGVNTPKELLEAEARALAKG